MLLKRVVFTFMAILMSLLILSCSNQNTSTNIDSHNTSNEPSPSSDSSNKPAFDPDTNISKAQGELTSEAENKSPDTGNSKTQDGLTLDEIKQNCAKTGETIISTREYKNYAIVESQPGNSRIIFTLYNLKTGDKDLLPTGEYRIDTEKTKIINENHIIFYSNGKNYVNGYQAFPLEIDCERGAENTGSDSDFIPTFKDIKLPAAEQLSVNGKFNAKEEITDIRATVNGLQVCFGPQDINDDFYSAAYIDCPTVDISYDETSREFTLKYKDTRLSGSYVDISSLPCNNTYIKSLTLKKDGDSAAIIIKLDESARYYTGKKPIMYFDMANYSDFPYMDIQFFNSNMYF